MVKIFDEPTETTPAAPSYPSAGLRIPESEYRQSHHLTSTLLVDFMHSPALYRMRREGALDRGDTPALTTGRVIHKLVLEGDAALREEFFLPDWSKAPVNPRTKKPYKSGDKIEAWLEEQSQGRPTCSEEDLALATLARAQIESDPRKLLPLPGFPEVTFRATIEGVECQCRVDWLSAGYAINDLKTCDNMQWFGPDCEKFSYPLKLAFYREVVKAATGRDPKHVAIVAFEKKPPYAVARKFISPTRLDAERERILAALRRLRECQETDSWPTGHETDEEIV